MIDFTIKPDGGEAYEVTATTRDIYVWEKAGRDRTINKLIGDVSMQAMYELAHVAARRQQLFTGALDEFVESCDLDFEQPEDVDPTLLARSTGR